MLFECPGQESELAVGRHTQGPFGMSYREGRCLFSAHRLAPCLLAFAGGVHSRAFERGPGAPRFLEVGGGLCGVELTAH